MGFAKRRAGIFHNFAMMKRSTRFLPPDKRRDLQQLVALIREQIKQVEMVILFGSYAKNSYVDYDQRITVWKVCSLISFGVNRAINPYTSLWA